jgi:FkbM family methyltransferase
MFKSFAKLLIRNNFNLPRSAVSDVLRWTTLRDVLRAEGVNVVIDVGANSGQFASSLRSIGYSGHIISFEPSPIVFSALSKNFSTDLRWKGFNCALGSVPGTLPFNYVEGSTYLSSFLPLKPSNRSVKVVDVKVERLDAIFSKLTETVKTPRFFLKCDTQGYDYQVILGAEKIIDKISGLQSEITVDSDYYVGSLPYYKNLERYESMGFKLMGLFEGGRLAKSNRISEYDCIMVRA